MDRTALLNNLSASAISRHRAKRMIAAALTLRVVNAIADSRRAREARRDALGQTRVNASLAQALAACNLTHRPAAIPGRRTVHDATGAVVCTGNAGEIWAWLHTTGWF